jgi:5-methyltetrahydrofolate--homocysteine methyltransferase
METIRAIRSRLGVNVTLGASNISYGMPDRVLINNNFLAMVIEAGVTCPMVDVNQVRASVLATDLLLNKDKFARRYIKAFRERQNVKPA